MSEEVEREFARDLRLLGERIRSSRKERGLTVRDMVVKHGYHDAQWRRFEKGVSLTVPSLLRIAKALGLSVSILLDGVGEFGSPNVGELMRSSKHKREAPPPSSKEGASKT